MIVNFIKLRNVEQENNNNIITDDTCNICIFSSCLFILYFLLTVPMIFMDIILGIMYKDNCIANSSININDWMTTNGIVCYLHLFILILLNRVYTDNTFFRKLLKYSGYIINIIILIWAIIGSVIFFKYYYTDNKCPLFFYNYLLIRIILSPLIVILRFIEIYNV